MRETIFHILFWASSAFILYIYLGYAVLLALLTRRRRSHVSAEPATLPHVSLLISAYNERRIIAEKLLNALSLDYPQDRLEILVISDCSDDGTDEIVGNFCTSSVRLIRLPERVGKSVGLNVGVSQAIGDILIFSDANAMYQSDAARELVKHFSDPGVGYVVGNARYSDRPEQTASAKSEGLYWKLETWLKWKESDFGSVVGGDGAIYAIRRDLFSPLQATDINDLLNPLQIVVRGYRGVYEPAAVCFEEAAQSFAGEFRRKVRIVSRSLNALSRAPRVLVPWPQPRHWFALVSHKVLRWFGSLFLILVFLISSVQARHSTIYRTALYLQLTFYILAAVGWTLERRGSAPRMFYLPYYFCMVNVASLVGIAKFLRGSLSPTWQTIREEAPAKRVSVVSRDTSLS